MSSAIPSSGENAASPSTSFWMQLCLVRCAFSDTPPQFSIHSSSSTAAGAR